MAKDAKSEDVAARLAAKEQAVADYYARSEAAKPTPTQEENDLAKVGALNIDEKEDDGSEWEADVQRRVMEGHLDNPYNVRAMDATDSAPSRRGRPKKGE